MARKTPVDKLNDAIAKILTEYQGDIRGNIDRVARSIGQKGVTALKQSTKQAFPSSKNYQPGWRAEYKTERLSTSVTIYNASRPGLAHLLENGHLMRNGQRWTGRPHIKPVEDELVETFTREVLSKL